MGAVGGFVGPYAVGYLKDTTGSFRSPLFLLAGILVDGLAVDAVPVSLPGAGHADRRCGAGGSAG